jgi:hypothetical protein
MFYRDWMSETDAKRVLAVPITGTVERQAPGRPLTEAEETETLADITEVAARRGDLLVRVTGLVIGFSEGTRTSPSSS